MPDDIQRWFDSRVPKDWFTGPVEVTADSEEILLVGSLPDWTSLEQFLLKVQYADKPLARHNVLNRRIAALVYAYRLPHGLTSQHQPTSL